MTLDKGLYTHMEAAGILFGSETRANYQRIVRLAQDPAIDSRLVKLNKKSKWWPRAVLLELVGEAA